jgi:ferric-chelate reductase [NAD(P)H]
MKLEALFSLSYGLYVVSSINDDKLNAQIANTVFQITSNPPTIAISINKNNLTYEFIKKSGVFSVSVLSQETPMQFIGHFGFKSGRDIDKFKNVEYKIGTTGAPIVLSNSISYIEAEVINSTDYNTHVVFAGKIIDADILDNKQPMTYSYYHKVKNGKSPKNAPTYIESK